VTINWGILSTAGINAAILRGARESDRARVIAVASRELERASAYASESSIERAYGSYDELLADPDLHAVYISLPNSLHAQWSIRALEAGKHVLCEKPFSADPTEVEAAFDAADANGVLLMEAFMYRHHPQTKAITELLRDGSIGDPRFIRLIFAFNGVRIFAADNIRFDAELGGGALMDVGAYCISSIRLVAGEPTRVSGTQQLGPSGVDLAFAGTFEFESGLLAQFECGFTSGRRSELEVVGTDGRFVVSTPWRIEEPGIDLWTSDGHRRIDIEDANAYRLELDNLSAAIAGEEEPLLGRADALAQARVLAALREAASSGRTVDL
jgi:D-xylose 1-dehydrogenase (NADP+, D-xylono-1,5-lactone-forming)